MARILNLPAADALTGAESLPLVQAGVTKRGLLSTVAAMVAGLLPAEFKGDPGSALVVGLFSQLGGLNIPGGTDVVRTGGHSTNGLGGAFYKAVAAGPATAWRKQSGNGRWFELIPDPFVSPEMFGALGDGLTNDTTAFQQLASFITLQSGGTIECRPLATYIVGRQTLVNNGNRMFAGEPVLRLLGCTRTIIIRGNGARMKVADGLKFGTFDAAGNPTVHAQPYYVNTELSTPIEAAVLYLEGNSGPITVSELEIDGNLPGLEIGGPYGDTGWQLPHDAIICTNNKGPILFQNCKGNHCPRDGLQIGDAVPDESFQRTQALFLNCDFIGNGRQGLSFVGGHGYRFVNCRFNDTGTGVLYSAPGAGVDLEAEVGSIRHLSFEGCEFSNTVGAGLLFVGEVTDIHVSDSAFIGTIGWTIYGPAPRSTFKNCKIVGTFVNLFATSDRAQMMKFENCHILDDPAYSPTGTVFLHNGWSPDLGGSGSALFDQCRWEQTDLGRGPITTTSIFRDCSVEITGTPGNICFMDMSRIEGTLKFVGGLPDGFSNVAPGAIVTYNGAIVHRATAAYDPPEIAAGASVAIPVPIPHATLGMAVDAAYSLDLQGVELRAYMSATEVAIVVFRNDTGAPINLGAGIISLHARTLAA